jgi:hypothetical protein
MEQGEVGRAAVGASLWRRGLPPIIVISSALLLLFGLFIAGPWFLRNPPGPNNPSFAWYLLFKSFPLILFTAVWGLLVAAYKLWRRDNPR